MVVLLCLVCYGEISRTPHCDAVFLVIASGCRDGLEKWLHSSYNQLYCYCQDKRGAPEDK